jgi:site-specific DNA-methyltransferase (adenine-specific)
MPDQILRPRPSAIAAGQLALELPSALPSLGIEPEWKDQARLWGHSLHPMCSYLASFPAALAHAFIARYTRPGDVVLDPFSGRGTAPLQAVAEGRIGIGNDLNPLAQVLTAAKLEPATPAEARTRLAALRLAWAADASAWAALAARVKARPGHPSAWVPAAGTGHRPDARTESIPDEVALAFHERTLAQVLLLRTSLRMDDRTDRFLLGALAGILHGKTPSYLSTIMPNTFSMAPRYVRDFVERSGYEPPERDAFDALAAKLDRLYRQPLPATAGIALQGDARTAGRRARAALKAHGLPDRARLVVTSPPYLRVLKYGYYNWLRTWLLGFDAAAIDAELDAAHRREPYLAFLREVLADLRPALTDDGIAVVVIGEVETDRGKPSAEGIGLAERAWEEAAMPAGFRLAGVVSDVVAANRKMTRLWGDQAGRATKTDRILVLGASEAGRRRARSTADLPIDWTWPPSRLRAI